jgi:hypothetical protein
MFKVLRSLDDRLRPHRDSESLTGHWLANSGDNFSFAELDLQQTPKLLPVSPE